MISTEDEKKALTQPISEPEVTDVDLGYEERKKFRINGDYDRVLELNISDLNIFSRFTESYPKLQQLLQDAQDKVQKINTEDDDESLKQLADVLKEIDADMRKQIDYIFNSNVSEVCAPDGTMYDPVNGSFRFEHIIDVVAKLYTNGLDKELSALKKKTSKHTSKYTKKYHK